MCSLGYHHSGSVGTHALVYHVPKSISCHKTTVVITGRTHCFYDYVYIYIYIYIYIYYIYQANFAQHLHANQGQLMICHFFLGFANLKCNLGQQRATYFDEL